MYSLQRVYRSVITILLFASSLWASCSLADHSPPATGDTIYLQLRWHHQFQFAGYYAAVEKGFYRDEGLDVRLRAGDPNHQPVPEVLAGRAQYAEGNSEVLFQRLRGEPLVALASVFQHSPSVLLTLKSSGIRSVHDLVGKNVMLANRSEDADFLTMFLNEGIEPSQMDIVPSSYQLDDLISGKTDAFNSYTTNEPFVLQQLGLEYNVINPASYSVDFYSDILFTSEHEVQEHPERVKKMLRATLKGWRYAMDNPQEVIEILKTSYGVEKSRAHMRFEEQEMRKLILPDLIQLGHMNHERWQHMADTFIKAGVISDDRHLDGFVYDPDPTGAPEWLMPALLATIALLAITSSITFYLHRFNRRLAMTQETLQQSEERFRAISAATYGGIVIHDQGVILECNDGMSDITGFSYSELVGMDGLKLIAPEHIDTVRKHMREDYRQGYEVVGLRKDGSEYPLSIKGKNITYKGRNARVIECLDITEQKATQDRLKLAASVFTHAREGIMITDADGTIVEVNDTFTYITGYSREEALGRNPRFLSSGMQSPEFYREMWQALDNCKQWSGELWNCHKSGRLYAELITISAVQDGKGNTQNYVALFSDITPMKEHQQQLEHIAHYDSLTNLPNRMLLADRLQHAMNQCERRNQSLAVAYLDLDGFKAINDAYGHNVGDELLVELAKLMSESLREGDTLARIGGDEFVAVLVDIDKMSDCEQVLERLLAAAMSRVTIAERSLQVSTSIGVTLYPQDGVDADQLLRHADQAMYVAKQTGKNRYHLFDVHRDQSIQTQHETVEHIQRGLERNEFILYYQPKVNMRSGDIVGVEALIRWQHPERGLVLPGDFLPIIENHPISLELGEWVIGRALDQVVEWQSAGLEVLVSVNIDAYQLQQPGFAEKLQVALDRRPSLKAHSLQLEILETSALGDMADVTATMHACINGHVSFSLDDFGTGFSSLTYLKRLPVEVLKIDQSFVRDMLDDADDRAIVQGVISMAAAFKHQVIAEGVETIDHGTQLLSMGCELAQGYGIARPMPAQQFPDWVKQWRPAPDWASFTPRT